MYMYVGVQFLTKSLSFLSTNSGVKSSSCIFGVKYTSDLVCIKADTHVASILCLENKIDPYRYRSIQWPNINFV